ncbi:NfeD family protein [Magnetospirillum sulfuroxidans]|uniref:NfeD family protein n=1 Tax=Magnetospirillum sulfuroxidans TaxID=611300 RepID=A0ABS5ID84_9PROT|nr:NfeD family protein [Magnetospirillum sulfuroxidans]MBR9972392.1 NfeD family protein [Magnetospirillum sulfuroxidans]
MQPVFWHWLIAGVVLIGAEAMVPGTYLLWPGIAAFLTGMVAYMAPGLGWEIHAVIFAALTVVAAVAGRKLYSRLKEPASQAPLLNRRAAQLVGTIHTLDTPILDGYGRMKLGDTTWKVCGPDLPTGARVTVVGADGIVLKVEAAS